MSIKDNIDIDNEREARLMDNRFFSAVWSDISEEKKYIFMAPVLGSTNDK